MLQLIVKLKNTLIPIARDTGLFAQHDMIAFIRLYAPVMSNQGPRTPGGGQRISGGKCARFLPMCHPRSVRGVRVFLFLSENSRDYCSAGKIPQQGSNRNGFETCSGVQCF